MTAKRILLSLIGLLVCLVLVVNWIKRNEGGHVPYPISLGSFFTVESTPIDPITLLEDIRSGKELILQVQAGMPEQPSFTIPIGWTQSEYLEIAQAFHRVIWKDDPEMWNLYKAEFYTSCENTTGKFRSAEFYYYQKVKKNGKRMYSVRDIYIDPESGYISWGWDTFYPRPIFGGWTEIDLENITKIPAEKALELADQRGGNDFRKKENNICRIHILTWPWGYDTSDWSVYYSGKIIGKYGSPQNRCLAKM